MTALAADPAVQLRLDSPQDYEVFQRLSREAGEIVISGTVQPASKGGALPEALEARLSGVDGEWRPLPWDARVAAFRAVWSAPAGGWYRLEVRAKTAGQEVAGATVEHVGVGEVFVIAGQSNSANYGDERQVSQSGRVGALRGAAWQRGDDPVRAGGGGSFHPVFGDLMVQRLDVPIGVIPMGIGSTSVREWLPAGTRLASLPTLTANVVTSGEDQWEAKGNIFAALASRLHQLGPHRVRAVLWHQGESDANQADPTRTLSGALYREYLEKLIRESRQAAGWEIPWFVARASYHSASDPASPEIRDAQAALWANGVALEGPDTDTLTGEMREKHGEGVHLSGEGLRAHGRMWAEKVGPWLEQQLAAQRPK